MITSHEIYKLSVEDTHKISYIVLPFYKRHESHLECIDKNGEESHEEKNGYTHTHLYSL